MAAENFKVKKGLEVGTGITANSDGVNVTGIITATQFKGDGSGLTGVVGSGSGVVVKDEGSAVGTAGTINFVGSGVAATLSSGTATVTVNAGGLDNVVEDTTPQLGGNLDLNSKFITGSGNIDITGSLDVSGISTFAGITTVTGETLFTKQLNVTGVSTFGNNINASGTSRFEIASMENGVLDGEISHNGDATTKIKFPSNNNISFDTDGTTRLNINNSGANITGVITATGANITGIATFTGGVAKLLFNGNQKLTTTINGIEVPDLNVTGVGTVGRLDTSGVTLGTNSTTFAAKFADNARAIFGGATQGDFGIYHDTNHSYLQRIPGGTGDIYVKLGGDDAIIAKTDNSVELYWDNAKKLETDSAGVKITGVATATSFSGSGAGLTNIPSAQLSGALPALDGSALTGITASGSGIIVKHDGSTVGTAGTINFSTNLDVSAISAGIVTVTATGGSSTQDKIEEGNSSAEVVGISTGDGEFKVILQDYTSSGAGHTTLHLYQSANDTNKLDLFRENFSNKAEIEIKSVYSGYGRHNIKFVTNNASYGAELQVLAALGQWNFYSKYQNTNKNVISFNHNSIGIGNGLLYPITNNGTDLGNSSQKFGSFHVGNVQAGIVTAATRFVGSGVSLTTLNASELDSGTIPNGRFPATLPATSGANLTALNASEITSGTLPIARIADDAVTFAKMQNVGTGVFIGRNDGGTGDIETLTAAEARTLLNVADGATAGITTAPSNIVATWNVVNQSASAYRFTGPGQDPTANNPDIYLVRGNKYRFALSASGHPFQIRVSNGGSAYNDGVTNNGAQTGNVEFYVQNDAPASLVYQCTSHGGMVGNIYITGHQLTNGADNRVVTATSAYGLNGESGLTFSSDRLILTNTSTPQIRINNDTSDGSSTRFVLGKATGSNNFFNGAVAGDSCIGFPGDLLFGVGTSLKMRIDSDGVVTKPNHPAFCVKGSNMSRSNADDFVVEFNNDSSSGCFDNGGNFNTSTHKFVAPVSGYYHFQANVRLDGWDSGYIRMAILSTSYHSGLSYWQYPSTGHIIKGRSAGGNRPYENFSTSTTMYLPATHEAYVYMTVQNETSFTVYLGESSFSGHLIG